MPELRKDPVIGRWVIISTERGKRPTDFTSNPAPRGGGFCPFCTGNESKTLPEEAAKYEPCGLNQMYSMRYGTVPVVRKTGGLADSVIDLDASGDSTGLVFEDYSADALYGAVSRARETYRDADAWKTLLLRGMKRDFSWEQQSRQYIETYVATLKKRKVVTES